MICEPINELPQQIDLKDFKLEAQPYFTATDKKIDETPKHHRTIHTQLEYDILPISFSDNYHQLGKVLSLRDNEYLSCRWNQFLYGNIDNSYPKILLYSDLKMTKPRPRKLTLNGQFYGVDNKLSPIPVMDDPRNLEKKQSRKKPPCL